MDPIQIMVIHKIPETTKYILLHADSIYSCTIKPTNQHFKTLRTDLKRDSAVCGICTSVSELVARLAHGLMAHLLWSLLDRLSQRCSVGSA